MTIRFVLKSGYAFDMKCKSFSLGKSPLGEFESWKAEGITENKPVHMDLEDVSCIYRVMSDEVEHETD